MQGSAKRPPAASKLKSGAATAAAADGANSLNRPSTAGANSLNRPATAGAQQSGGLHSGSQQSGGHQSGGQMPSSKISGGQISGGQISGGEQSEADARSALYTTGLFSQRPPTAARQLNLDEVDAPNERTAEESPPPAHRRQSIIGSAVQGIKRPLTALLKRPGSRSGSRERKSADPSESIDLPAGESSQSQPKPGVQPARKQGLEFFEFSEFFGIFNKIAIKIKLLINF